MVKYALLGPLHDGEYPKRMPHLSHEISISFKLQIQRERRLGLPGKRSIDLCRVSELCMTSRVTRHYRLRGRQILAKFPGLKVLGFVVFSFGSVLQSLQKCGQSPDPFSGSGGTSHMWMVQSRVTSRLFVTFLRSCPKIPSPLLNLHSLSSGKDDPLWLLRRSRFQLNRVLSR